VSDFAATLATVVTFVVVGTIIYLLPAFIAAYRLHPQCTAISLLNFFLGWTFLGWVVALVWSVMAVERSRAEGCANG